MTYEHESSLPQNDDLPELEVENASDSESDEMPVAITCPVCGLVNRPGELACSRCGTVLAMGGTTRKLGTTEEPQQPANWPTGEVILTEQEPIVLIVGDEQIPVPIAEMITVVRNTAIPHNSTPDAPLTRFS